MKAKQIAKIITDILMTFLLLLLMARSLVGETAHEWMGIGMFALFVLHHTLNNRWNHSILKGRYTPFRILQTVLVALALVCMLGSMVSGIVVSRHVFTFLGISEGQYWARTVHMLCAYWGFTVISLHLGLHWNLMMGMAGRIFQRPSMLCGWVIRIAGWLIAGYGVYVFFKREIVSYMLLKNQFVFFDFSEPLIFFLFDYMTVMGLFVCIGYYAAMFAKRMGKEVQK